MKDIEAIRQVGSMLLRHIIDTLGLCVLLICIRPRIGLLAILLGSGIILLRAIALLRNRGTARVPVPGSIACAALGNRTCFPVSVRTGIPKVYRTASGTSIR